MIVQIVVGSRIGQIGLSFWRSSADFADPEDFGIQGL
jgi:hypothetical protein